MVLTLSKTFSMDLTTAKARNQNYTFIDSFSLLKYLLQLKINYLNNVGFFYYILNESCLHSLMRTPDKFWGDWNV